MTCIPLTLVTEMKLQQDASTQQSELADCKTLNQKDTSQQCVCLPKKSAMDHQEQSSDVTERIEEETVRKSPEIVEVTEGEDGVVEKTEVSEVIDLQTRGNENIRGGGAARGFMSARAVLLNESRENVLSPGFRSVAAMAGWDDEALLLASFEEGSSSLGNLNLESLVVEDSPVRESRQKKREARTPALAKTPASAGRRHRRARRQSKDIDPIDLDRVGALSLEDDPFSQSNEPNPVSQTNEPNPILQAQLVQGNAVPGESSTDATAHNEKKNSPLKLQGDSPKIKPRPAKSKERSPRPAESSPYGSENGFSKPSCLEQLKEELSCAVCLDICFEPSSTSCGHSFCKMCLQDAIEKCGPRCPKCRQQLRGDFQNCQINTVLWNTVQLLFPKEVAGKIKEKNEKEAASKHRQKKENSNSYISQANRGARNNGVSWQGHSTRSIGLTRPTSNANFRRAFQSSAEDTQIRHILVPSDEEIGQEVTIVATLQQGTMGTNERAARRQERRGRNNYRQENQEEVDAALASRLQQEELMRSFRAGGRNRVRASRAPTEQTRTVSSAAANLRAMASRAINLRVRNQS